MQEGCSLLQFIFIFSDTTYYCAFTRCLSLYQEPDRYFLIYSSQVFPHPFYRWENYGCENWNRIPAVIISMCQVKPDSRVGHSTELHGPKCAALADLFRRREQPPVCKDGTKLLGLHESTAWRGCAAQREGLQLYLPRQNVLQSP